MSLPPLGPDSRALGLDVGTKTIGVAVSDPLAITAQPVETIRRTTMAEDLRALRAIAALYKASVLVVGYPRNMDGSEGEQARFVAHFIEALAALGLPVETMDERLTTFQAQRAMKAANVKAKRRKEIVDQQAAAIILQTYMDRLERLDRLARNPDHLGGSSTSAADAPDPMP